MNKPKFVVIHRTDKNNVGDIASNPLQYFLSPDEYVTVDIAHYGKQEFPTDVPIIVGGGGLIANEFFGDVLEDILVHPDQQRVENLWKERWQLFDINNQKLYDDFIVKYEKLLKTTYDKIKSAGTFKAIWGAGHNSKDINPKKGINYPSYLLKYNAVGIRDYGTGYNWVPCASCMHDALTKEYEIKNDVVWFEHKKQLVKDFGNDSIPRYINSGNNVEHTIELLGSANIILTNSYHGAYWGTLLGKRVVVVDEWSTKFKLLKHQPYFLDKKQDWKEIVDEIPVYTDALEECRTATQKYWNEIKSSV
jgi:hypothetical protein